jgi:A/G-specific adenine glycosylase
MLQQTQVARVIEAYRRFLQHYPDPASLATATTEEVIEVWGDLGYLRRAVNLQRTARILSRHGWPEDLTSLPGVGPYTAAAVGTFAFGRRTAAVDVNLRRVLSRWSGMALTVTGAIAAGDLHVDVDRPADWNHAMMDLGSGPCRPKSPVCSCCPVSSLCRDPAVEVTSRRQTPYHGSVRQARAAVMKALTAGPLPLEALLDMVGLEYVLVTTAIAALESEHIIRREADVLALV